MPPRSLATGDTGLTKQLREVDLVRPLLERIVADIPRALCNVWVLADDEIVLVASAGGVGIGRIRDAGQRATELLGGRLPATIT